MPVISSSHVLQYGAGRAKVGDVRTEWAQGLGPQDRAMVDAFLSLPAPQRRLVRDLVVALAGVGEVGK